MDSESPVSFAGRPLKLFTASIYLWPSINTHGPLFFKSEFWAHRVNASPNSQPSVCCQLMWECLSVCLSISLYLFLSLSLSLSLFMLRLSNRCLCFSPLHPGFHKVTHKNKWILYVNFHICLNIVLKSLYCVEVAKFAYHHWRYICGLGKRFVAFHIDSDYLQFFRLNSKAVN